MATLIALGIWLWSTLPRRVPLPSSDLYIASVQTFGRDSGAGNLVAISPWMATLDYSSEESFTKKIRGYFEEARRRAWISSKTIVVLPEYLGTWLVAVDEPPHIYDEATTDRAMLQLVALHLPKAAWQAARSPASDRLRYAVLSFKSDRMAAVYDRCLSTLAREFGVTIVGGSIVLQSPSVQDGHLVSNSGKLYNVSPVYKPTGQAYPDLSVKSYPTLPEKPFLAKGDSSDLPVFDTPAGRLGVLICADSWFPEAYAVMRAKRAQTVVSPTIGPERGAFEKIWPGYSGWPNAADIDPKNPGHIRERDAFLKYALAGRLAKYRAGSGVCSFLGGRIWDMDLQTMPVAVINGESKWMPEAEGATLVNVWLTH